MRMLADATRVLGRGKKSGTGIVQHEKGIDLPIQLIAGKEVAHGKPVPDHMRGPWLIDT
jgi:hypothetical protein